MSRRMTEYAAVHMLHRRNAVFQFAQTTLSRSVRARIVNLIDGLRDLPEATRFVSSPAAPEPRGASLAAGQMRLNTCRTRSKRIG